MEWTPSMSQWHLKYVYLTIWVYFCTPSTTSSLSLSLSLTDTHTREINVQLEAGPNTCVWRHCLPLSSSTHDHQKASHWISAEFSVCQVRKSQNQNLEFGPKESEVPKNKNLQKKSTLGLAFKLGGGREEGVKCC